MSAQTARKPSILRPRVLQRSRTLLYISLDVRHPRGAARAAQKHRRRPRVLLTAYARRGAPEALWTLWSDASGHDRPIPPTMWLVLDTTSAGSEGTVVLNVIVTHTRPRNTCNVKGGPPRAGPRRPRPRTGDRTRRAGGWRMCPGARDQSIQRVPESHSADAAPRPSPNTAFIPPPGGDFASMFASRAPRPSGPYVARRPRTGHDP